MNVAKKVVFNTVVLYAKIIISLVISLVSVPLILNALGASDYGLYNVVAGVVSLLAFLTNSMVVSTQRYMSVAMGTNDKNRVNTVFNSSFRIHVFMGVVIVLLLEILACFVPRLNIPEDRIVVAQIIYQFLVLSTFIRVVGVPYGALTNAHEDMLAFSIIDVIDSLLMLALAVSLKFLPFDKLIFYGLGMLGISIAGFFMMYWWTRHAYKDYRIRVKEYKDNKLEREMMGFAGWNLFGSVAVIGRNQGVAIIVNLFLGTIANAAYGIANQVNSALLHFSTTFQKAINPQLMKSEGMNNRDRLNKISFISSKFSVLAMSLFAIPLILEMPEVLHIWLRDSIPPYTMELSRCILVFSIMFQYSNGIMSAIQATGKIRNYQITMGLIILLNLPLSYIFLKLGYPVYFVTIGYIALEIVSLTVRVFMARNTTGMKITDFISFVMRPTFIIIFVSTIICLIPYLLLNQGLLRVVVVSISYGLAFAVLSWFLAFDNQQRESMSVRLKSFIHR